MYIYTYVYMYSCWDILFKDGWSIEYVYAWGFRSFPQSFQDNALTLTNSMEQSPS
jgi:hypothetical protein